MLLAVFLFVVVPVVLAVSIAIVLCIHRRIQQVSVLSLLAISAHRGLPLAEEVSALSASRQRSRKRKLKLLATALAGGEPLSQALANDDSIVPAGTVLAASAGEQATALGRALREKAAQETESLQRMYLGTPFVWLLAYFIAVLTVAQCIVMFQMYYIVPKMKKIFEDFGTELPAMTVMVIQVSDLTVKYFFAFIPLYWGPILLLLFIGLLLFRRWNFLKIPWMSRWLPREDTPALLRALAYIVEAGRPLPQALARLTEVLGHSAVRRRLEAVQKAVESGENCWRALSRQSLLNRAEVALLESAEEMGNLPFVLRELAGNVERRREYRLYLLLELMRPVVVIGLGVIVGVFCMAFFLPVIKLILDLA
ncbi:MAG: type II secretion system F family protein [Planctomycetaceae bacterium]